MKALNILVIIALLLVFIAFSFWYTATPKVNLIESSSLSSSPDYFVTKVSVKRFDISGALIETLDAAKTLHYLSESKTLLNTPKVQQFSEYGSWTGIAENGVIHDGSNDILLTHNTKATKKHLESEDIIIRSDSVHYLDKNQSFKNFGNAEITTSQGSTLADEITTYINSEEVLMTGSVRGNYETIH